MTTQESAAAAAAVPYGAPRRTGPTLLAAVLGFFVITLDAVIVNVALTIAAVIAFITGTAALGLRARHPRP